MGSASAIPVSNMSSSQRSAKLQMVPSTTTSRSTAETLPVILVFEDQRSLSEEEVDKDGIKVSCSSEDLLGEDVDDDDEVESPLREGSSPLEQMDALESSLPLKRGLSRFFGGRSRSFTSLAKASSVEDLSKPESPFQYVKRRKLLHSYQQRRWRKSDNSSSPRSSAKMVGMVGDWNGISPALVNSITSLLPRSFTSAELRLSSIHN